MKNKDIKNESILDHPQQDLDPAVWTKNSDGEYVLTIQADEKIKAVADWAIQIFEITDSIIHITGSIASNSFGEDSDIDLHFCSKTFNPDDIDEFNKSFREAFDAEFGKDTGSELGFIGTHPLEVYFQQNPFQDMMSVGCYDYTNKKWESGPDIKDTAFDPYSKYYEKDMKYVGKLANDIRNQILDVYEKAIVLSKSKDQKFRKSLFKKTLKSLNAATELFTAIRKKRKVMSQPKSKEQALKMRKDRKWHIADSAFKLFDKFGYLAVLRSYTQLVEKHDNNPNLDEYIKSIINATSECFQKNAVNIISEKEVQGMTGWDDKDLKSDILSWLSKRIDEYQLDIEIIDISLHGSRTRNDFRPDSDLDVIVYYKGTADRLIKEDHIWNMLNDDPQCEIDGVTVDFWPTRDEESGSLPDVLQRNAKFDEMKADGNLEEGLGSAIRNTALAGLMLAPGMALAKSRSAAVGSEKPSIVQTVKTEKKYGKLSESNLKNLLATIAYNETMLDWLKYKDDDEIIAVLNTINNRAGGDKTKYAFVISEKSQYFSAKHVRGGYDDATYAIYDPNEEAKLEGGSLSKQQKECWKLCQNYAQQLIDGKLKNVIGDRNMIGNKKKDTDKTAIGPNGWGAKCDKVIGGQQFGYQANWDGYKRFKTKKLSGLTHIKPTRKSYIVKRGDTLWNIAKSNNTTVQKLKSNNGLSTDQIQPGQKLFI